MPTKRHPRKGSLQYWPRKAAGRPYARISHYPSVQESRLIGFAGYKAGMTHIFVADNRQHSMTKGKSITMPVTIVECPPLKVASIRLYRSAPTGLSVARELFVSNDKNLARKLRIPKKENAGIIAEAERSIKEYSDV